MKTKRDKTITTRFFPVGELPLQIVTAWITFLRCERSFRPDDPLFPATLIKVGNDRKFAPAGVSRNHWTTASPIRAVFARAFALAGSHYHNPHSFRSTLVRLGERLCRTPEEFKAWSQNLGHEGVMTTFSSYGRVPEHRQVELIGLVIRPVSKEYQLAGQIARLLREDSKSSFRERGS